MYFYIKYFEVAIIIIMTVVSGYWVKKKVRLVKWEQINPVTRDVVKKNEDKINCWVRRSVFAICLFVMLLQIPIIMDFGSFLNKDFESITGVVVSQDHEQDATAVNRTVHVKSLEDDEIVDLYIYSCPYLEKGEPVTVKYLKYSHYAILEE